MSKIKSGLLCTLVLAALPSPPAHAGDQPATAPLPAPSATVPFWAQSQLTGDWGGVRQQLSKDDGLTIALTWVADGFDNFTGGIRQGATLASTLDLKLTLDTSVRGWQGGTFYLDLQDHAGKDPSEVLTGDLQRFANYSSDPFFQVEELWYQQTLFNSVLRLKVGKMDANDEFTVIDNGANFLNSSAQNSPTIFNFPTYPLAMPGAVLAFTPVDFFYAKAGGFYDNRSGGILDFYGAIKNQVPVANGFFYIAEAGLQWKHLTPCLSDGDLRIGGWDETGTFTRLDGADEKGGRGFYAILNQTLWKPTAEDSETRGLRTFLEYAQCPSDIDIIHRHIGAGIVWTGPCSGRPADLIGIGPEYVQISDKAGEPKPFELAAEAFYQYQLGGWGSLQPDLQYICHPGGEYQNALVGTLQWVVNF